MDEFLQSLDRTVPHVRWNRPEEERPGTDLLVMLHGYGADEADLWSLTERLPSEFTVASVRAPSPLGPGFQWFPLGIEESEDSGGGSGSGPVAVKNAATVAAALASAQWLQHWVEQIRGSFASISVLGFSQGMCMATSLLRLDPRQYRTIVGLSGFVLDAQEDVFQDALVRELRPPVFWGRDQQDPVISQKWVEFTTSWLQTHTALTKVLYTGMGHGISEQEIRHVAEFLRVHALTTD